MDPQARELLAAVQQAGDSANLWEAGQSLGLERSRAEDLGTGLMAEGLLEMVNLGGAVRVSPAGADLLAGGGGLGAGGDDLANLVSDLETAGGLGLAEKVAADLAADVTALKAQLGRSRPLLPVVRACLEALEENLGGSGDEKAKDLARRAAALKK